MFKLLRFILCIVLAMAIVACYFQAWIPPTILGKGVFLGFAFPYLWALGFVALIFLIIIHAKISGTIMAIALLITSGGTLSLIRPLPVKEQAHEGRKIKMVTMNVCNLRGGNCGRDLGIEQIKKIFADADIVFLQEAPNDKRIKNMKLHDIAELFGFEYAIYDQSKHSTRKTESITQAILSRFPLSPDEPTDEDTDAHIQSAYADIDGQKVHLINCHLESIRLSQEQISTVNEVSHAEIKRSSKTELHETYSKMKTAFERRTTQAHHLVDMVKDETMPVILGGDFNDTPISYTYHKVDQVLFDTFRNSVMVYGNTFNGGLPPIRIDYIFHSAHFTSTDYIIHNDKQCSDHFAVSSVLWLKSAEE